MDEEHLNKYTSKIKQYYSEDYDYFLKSIEHGRNSGTKPIKNWDFEKKKQLITNMGKAALNDENKICIVFWGVWWNNESHFGTTKTLVFFILSQC